MRLKTPNSTHSQFVQVVDDNNYKQVFAVRFAQSRATNTSTIKNKAVAGFIIDLSSEIHLTLLIGSMVQASVVGVYRFRQQ